MQRSSDAAIWLPHTLQWKFHTLVLAASSILYAVVALLYYLSNRNYGLGDDNGSSALLFGWRFAPTLVAVLYAQLLVMQFEDVQKTEPYARMARPGGGKATMTVLSSPGFWWNALADGLSKTKNNGSRGWTLLCATGAYLIAVLAISPLSSSLLTSEDVVVPYETQFSRVTPANSPFNLTESRNVYLRTTNHLLRNLTTSAWTSDNYTVLPFGPADPSNSSVVEAATDNIGSWTASTNIFSADYSCKQMVLAQQSITNVSYVSRDHDFNNTETELMFNGTTEMASITLTADDGCVYRFDLNPYLDVARTGGVMWSTTTGPMFVPTSNLYTTSTSGGQIFQPDLSRVSTGAFTFRTLYPELSPASPFVRSNQTLQCSDRDIFAITTPWVGTESHPQIFLSNFTVRALLCNSSFLSAELPVTLSQGQDSSAITFSVRDFLTTRQTSPPNILDVNKTNNMLLAGNWTRYVDPPSFAAEGSALLAAAVYDYNVTVMLQDAQLSQSLSVVRARYFGELLQNVLDQPNSPSTVDVTGQSKIVERRIVVVPGVAITMAVLLFVCFCLVAFVAFSTDPERRPLHLRHDPATVLGVADFLSKHNTEFDLWKTLFAASNRQTTNSLRNKSYKTSSTVLWESGPVVAGTLSSSDPSVDLRRSSKQTCRPLAIRLRMLLAFSSLLICCCAAILILYTFATKSRLYQTGFVFQANISFLSNGFSFAPFSIIPTLLAVTIGLWWDALDKTFRTLQPYVAQSKANGSSLSSGAGLTYRSSYWIWAAQKATLKKHWLLVLITLGSCLCQIFTVSTSALFARETARHVQSVSLNRSLEMRQVPLLMKEAKPDLLSKIEASVFEPYTHDWIYSAINQLCLNGSQPLWSMDGWSFVPINVSNIANATSLQHSGDASGNSATSPSFSAQNITLATPAVRGRSVCTPIDELQQDSNWLVSYNLTGLSNTTTDKNLTTVYGLKPDLFDDVYLENSFYSGYAGLNTIGCVADFVNPSEEYSIGYWSGIDDNSLKPDAFGAWPLNFTAYWIHGPVHAYHSTNDITDQVAKQCDSQLEKSWVVFTEVPSMQAVNCQPIIETTDASVVLDKTGRVQSYTLGSASIVQSPWLDGFIRRNSSLGNASVEYIPGVMGEHSYDSRLVPAVMDVTTSYGVLFYASLIFSSSLTQLDPNSKLSTEAYRIQDPGDGLSMDLMTYSAYTLSGNNAGAMLNYTNFVNLTSYTFQTFFQHFVSHDSSAGKAGWAYQDIGTTLPDVGAPILWHWTNDSDKILNASRSYPILHTNHTAMAKVSTQIEVLRMNAVATWLSVGILFWLIFTTAIVAALEKRHLRPLRRNVESLADVMILVAGSDNLLRLVEMSSVEELMKDDEIRTRLGWFRTREGDIRWGVEVMGRVEESDAVRWIEAPKA